MKATKNVGTGFVLDIVSVALALAGMIASIVCSSISSDYALADLGMYIFGIIAALALVCLSVFMEKKTAPIASMLATGAGVFLLARVGLAVISSRIILISGLLTWNSANMVGWSVLYATIAATALLVASAVLLVVSAFFSVEKKK
ncbi:MAG: hypothetical protein ACI361_07955 [Atopobiaceae bacterium]